MSRCDPALLCAPPRRERAALRRNVSCQEPSTRSHTRPVVPAWARSTASARKGAPMPLLLSPPGAAHAGCTPAQRALPGIHALCPRPGAHQAHQRAALRSSQCQAAAHRGRPSAAALPTAQHTRVPGCPPCVLHPSATNLPLPAHAACARRAAPRAEIGVPPRQPGRMLALQCRHAALHGPPAGTDMTPPCGRARA